ncbi:MAG TPA: hypothetical protein VHB53_14435 [Solirubrobacterales bacterium]|nr:hypothetical protein [Solirubrobacterales bacterium]
MSADVDAAREGLREIIRLAGEVALASGPEDSLALRNRAVEIAAQAETLLWTVDPDASDWCLDLYERVSNQGD